ncbi:MAG: flagellar hook-associated protein FlgK [Elusimicrobia bacterium RIFOXYB2_FULL_49_7]|nr:MAG: flagellar hook-associated protein FlgK [Elusimicrobia bacterium RIFOXYB2_FULL_49_7]
MSGLFGTMNIGVRGLAASQLALNITSQNISNANTEGYSRKRLNLTSEYRRDAAYGQMGFGVEVTNITRLRDFFIDRQINKQTQEYNYYNEVNDTLTRLENIYAEPSDSALSKVLDNFWNAWSDLANNPESLAARNVVKANAEVLVDTFHNLSTQIRDLRDSKNDDISSVVSQVNQYLKQIYNLNKEIGTIEISSGAMANDARDQRDLAIKKLSELINVTTEEAGNGMINVLTNGNMLVSPSSLETLEVSTVTNTRSDGTSFSTLGIRYASTKKQYTPESGRLKGILDSRDLVVPYYEEQLDTIANTIVEQVNALHSRGYSLNGTSGIDFFKVSSHDEAVPRHNEVIHSLTKPYNPLNLPQTIQLGTPNINSSTFELRESITGTLIPAAGNYTLDPTTGAVTILLGSVDLSSPPQPAPPNQPNLVMSYTYEVPKGFQTIQQTYASNIELSAAIEQSVSNIAAAGGDTTRAYADTIQVAADGNYHYIHHVAGPDGIYGNEDDDPDLTPGSGDELRGISKMVQGSVTLTDGSNTLVENTDYFIDYSTGRIILTNGAYGGVPLFIEYQAAVNGTAGSTDNSNATAIAELRHSNIMSPDYEGNNTASITTFYNSFISELGIQKNEYTTNADARQFLVQQFESRQAEVAGVSLDEELANLVKYQHTYQAAARIITTVDKMIETLLQL